jgi:HEAT repeat protein
MASLNDEHDNVRAAAAEKLGKLKDPSAVPNLIQALKDPSTAVKEKAAEALGLIGRPDARPALEAALAVKSEDEWVTFYAAQALARCGGTKGVSTLIRLAEDADAKVIRTQSLASALSLTGRPAVKDPDDKTGKAALAELAKSWKDVESKSQWDPASGKFVVP